LHTNLILTVASEWFLSFDNGWHAQEGKTWQLDKPRQS